MKILASALLFAAAAAAAGGKRPAPAGAWGGPHAGLTLTESGGRIEFDCAHGTVDEPLSSDESGRFEARGTYSREHGGPIRKGEEEERRPARYSGSIEGDRMTLTVTVTGASQSVGTFVLERGKPGIIHKCL
jgi:hypothetical protein